MSQDPVELDDYNPAEWPDTEPIGDALIGAEAAEITPIYTSLGGK